MAHIEIEHSHIDDVLAVIQRLMEIGEAPLALDRLRILRKDLSEHNATAKLVRGY